MAATTAAVIGAAAAVKGASDSNQNAKAARGVQQGQLDRATAFTEQQAVRAREDAERLFGQSNQTAQAGFQGAADVFGQTIPQQSRLFQEGNVAAQQQLLAGLPQIQNAILGLPTDLSGLQPTQLGFNTDFANVQIPRPTQDQQQEVDIASLLGGLFDNANLL